MGSFSLKLQINLLELAIAKIKVLCGQLSPGPVPTQAYQRSMSVQEQEIQQLTMEQLRVRASSAVLEDRDLDDLYAQQVQQLELAKEAATEHQTLVSAHRT
jgi:hypothetical protein